MCLAAALLLRFGFAAYSFDGRQIFGSLDYEQIGINILRHGVYTLVPPAPMAVREPGYPLFIAGLYALSGQSPWAVLAAQAALSTATVYLVFRLALLIFDPRTSRAALWIASFYPYFCYYPGFLFRETLLPFLASAAFFVSLRSSGVGAGAGAGGLAGWMCLTNTALTPLTAAFGAFLAWQQEPARRWKGLLAFALVAGSLMGGWLLRNALVMKAFIPTSTSLGVEMYVAFSVPYEIRGTPEQDRILGRPGDDTEFQRISVLPELESNRAYVLAALRLAAARPWSFAMDCAGRFFGLWRIVPRDRAYTHRTSAVRLLALLSDGWVLPLALAGLVLGWSRPGVRWMGVFVLVLTMSFSISQSVIRYRLTVMPFVLILTARGALWLYDLAASRRAAGSR
ncbi:MAG: glycosyltransferase family 39 protein [Elusimicrobia bacterium]|nr:glycosyltransferase family 39 protein [Elusimicrobiota bacterium]